MKIALNLASQPYIDLRSILKRLRILMVVLALLIAPLYLLLRSDREKAQQATAQVAAMQDRLDRLRSRRQSYESLMRQPQNAAVLAQSEFLNSLFRAKAFSWTATMTDLETVLPQGVQVLSIDPQISKNGDVTVHLRVIGGRDRAVDLIRNLEKSRHFGSPRLAGESLAQTAASGPNAIAEPINASTPVNFDIIADYRPLGADEPSLPPAPPVSRRESRPGLPGGLR